MGYTKRIEYGFIQMLTPASTTLVNAEQSYTLLGTFNDADTFCRFFSCNNAGTLTYSGKGGYFTIAGTSDVSVDKACKLNYTLHINDVAGGTTPHDFVASSKTENISIAGIILLADGDELVVKGKSDTANTIVTPANLNLVTEFIKAL